MKNGIIFLTYHPGSLSEYDYIWQAIKENATCVLIICMHPYINEEIITTYSRKCKHCIILPDINYKTNIIIGLKEYFSFIRQFKKKIQPILANIDKFHIISDCSAYFPINALLTELRTNKKCRNLISIREDYSFKKKINFLKTMRSWVYTLILKMHMVYAHRTYSYMYINEPRDKIIRLLSPYEKNIRKSEQNIKYIPIYNVYKTIQRKTGVEKNIVIVYSDRQLDHLYDLSKQEYEKRLKLFFIYLSRYYEDFIIICKPHPKDRGQVMSGLQNIAYELYSGKLTSQMHLNMNAERVKACYSVSSLSLLYSSALGIPSYTFYHYLEFNGEYPISYFENDNVRKNPFLYQIRQINEIGAIDSLNVLPIESDCGDSLTEILSL